MRPVLFFALLFSGLSLLRADAGSGSGFFLSMDQIVQVQEPELWASRQFLLRQQAKMDELFFFRVPMSDLLYKSKKKFVLPQMEMRQRLAMPLFGSLQAAQEHSPLPEVLLNERLVLVDSDSLFALTPDGTLLQLMPAPPLGVALVSAAEGTSCVRMQQSSVANDCSLPAFFYTHKGHVPFIIVQRRGYRPVEMEAWVEPDAFQEFRPELAPLPLYASSYRFPALNLDSAGLTAEALDQMLNETRIARDEVEHEFESYLLAMEGALYVPAAKKDMESAVDYALRLGFRDSLLAVAGRSERQSPVYLGLIRELESRRLLLNAYRSQLMIKQEWSQGIQSTLLNNHVWRIPFFRLYSSLARQLPDWTTDPGPDGLWALGLGASYARPLHGNLGAEFRLDWLHSRWLFNESRSRHSSQNMAGLDVLASWPLSVAATSSGIGSVGGIAVMLVGGVGGALSNTQVYGDRYEHRLEWAPRGSVGFQIHWVDIALMTECLYRYDLNGFGDLGVAVAFPLTRFFRMEVP